MVYLGVRAHGAQVGDTIVDWRMGAEKIGDAMAFERVGEKEVCCSSVLALGGTAGFLDFFKRAGQAFGITRSQSPAGIG